MSIPKETGSATEGNLNIPTILCTHSDIQGTVTFGKGCIIHPGCSIIAEGGDIEFGDFCIIEERVLIFNKMSKDGTGNGIMKIGSFNVFEVGAFIESTKIGDNNTFQQKVNIEAGCEIKDCCTIGAGVRIPASNLFFHLETIIEDFSCVCYPGKIVKCLSFDEENYRTSVLGMIETLSAILPKQNSVKKI